LGEDKQPKVGGGASTIGTGRDQLAEALEDRFGRVGVLTTLAWEAEEASLRIRLVKGKASIPQGWEGPSFAHGPGGFATQAMKWLASLKADSWQLTFSDRQPDEVKLTPL
jgi:hypothetical protein